MSTCGYELATRPECSRGSSPDTSTPTNREPRFDAFVRTYVAQAPVAGDAVALADLRRDPSAANAFSIYLRARAHHEAIITLTEEGDLVLGLGLDDPNNDPDTLRRASALMESMSEEFGAVGGVAGVELPPPQSVTQWGEDGLVMLRTGQP
jgi:hypothetical protein